MFYTKVNKKTILNQTAISHMYSYGYIPCFCDHSIPKLL